MNLILLACVVGVVVSDPIPSYVGNNYHEIVGIKEAARIEAAEKATDFDGSRIVSGTASALARFPFMAGLSITLRTGFASVCGATLIHNTRALTAAHCWWDGHHQARQFIVILGAIAFNAGTRITTTNVQMHPQWDAFSLDNDIAIITFPWITYTNNIRNVALPTGLLATYDYLNSSAEAVGFGIRTDAGTVVVAQALHSVTLQVINNSVCRSLYGQRVVSTLICARGNEGRSTCDGDDGGPLVFHDGEKHVLIGVAAFNHRESCQLGYPVGFTRVTTHLDWINRFLIW